MQGQKLLNFLYHLVIFGLHSSMTKKFIHKLDEISFEKIINLYKQVGWSAYTNDPSMLKKALTNSTYLVILTEDSQLIGLARSISDDVSIHYLQDIIVSPQYQGKGFGKQLLEKCLERFSHVRTHMILTDNEERQKKFYQSLGYKNTSELKEVKLNAYVRMSGIELK